MREDTVTTKVYLFSELSDEAKQTAIEKLYDVNVDYEWWNFTFGDAATIGLIIEEFDVDCGSFCRGKWTEDAEDTARLILENHGDVCETYRDAEQFQIDVGLGEQAFAASGDWDKDWIADLSDAFADSNAYDELCEEFQRTICEDYLGILRRGYEYLTSEEAIIETIEVNEYEFTADGKLY